MKLAPLVNYAGSFVPYPGALRAGDKLAPEGCIKPSEGALMLAGRAESQGALGELVGVSRSLVAQWVGGFRHPAPGYQKALETRLGIPELAWSRWRPLAGQEGAAVEEGPSSAEQPVTREEAAAPVPEPVTLPENGTPVERARALLTFLAVSGRTPAQIAQAREIRHALALEARFAASATKELHEHPDFETWVDGLVAALARVPGALDALDLFLGVEPQKAAA